MERFQYVGYSIVGAGIFTLGVLIGSYFLPSKAPVERIVLTPPLEVASSSVNSNITPSSSSTPSSAPTSSFSMSPSPSPVVTPEETPIPTRPLTTTQITPVVPVPMPSPTTPAPANSLTVMAWLYPSEPGCNAATEYRDGRTIDVLKPEFFTINGGGKLTFISEAESACNGYSPRFVSDLKRYSREQFVTISSASTEDMDIFLNNALANETDITTLVTFVVSNNLTGIELDFEDFGGWSATSYINYKEFVTRLGTALRSEGKKLMLDGPAIADSIEQGWFKWRYEDFVNLPVDTIVVMLYDYQFDHGTGEPVAPLDWMKKVIVRTTTTFPASRLSIGIPSYGYEGIVGKRPYIRTYDQLKGKPGFANATRDERSGERTWTNGNTVYFYQDTESIRQKIAVVEASGVRSISVWHLGGNQWF